MKNLLLMILFSCSYLAADFPPPILDSERYDVLQEIFVKNLDAAIKNNNKFAIEKLCENAELLGLLSAKNTIKLYRLVDKQLRDSNSKKERALVNVIFLAGLEMTCKWASPLEGSIKIGCIGGVLYQIYKIYKYSKELDTAKRICQKIEENVSKVDA